MIFVIIKAKVVGRQSSNLISQTVLEIDATKYIGVIANIQEPVVVHKFASNQRRGGGGGVNT